MCNAHGQGTIDKETDKSEGVEKGLMSTLLLLREVYETEALLAMYTLVSEFYACPRPASVSAKTVFVPQRRSCRPPFLRIHVI